MGEKVTEEGIKARIEAEQYFILPGSTVTICSLRMENGFWVRGESACVDPANFNQKIGEELAYKDAFRRVWELEGYLLAERRYQQRDKAEQANTSM